MSAGPLILIVEDEAHLAQGLQFNLEADGYRVALAGSGEEAMAAVAAAPSRFDLLVLDVMLPGKNGFTVAAEIRAAGNYVPILMLTARGDSEDVLRGFAAGADDYLVKPVQLAILTARIHGLLRRRDWQQRGPQTPDRVELGGRVVDFTAQQVRAGERTLPLTLMEANLLRFLIRHEGAAVSRKAILEQVWGVSEAADTRAIDNFIVRLRRILEDDPGRPQHLLTVRSVGYRFVR